MFRNETRSHEELQALIAQALVQPSFCAALLNGDRQACLAEFALSADEYTVANAIEATDLSAFARQLDTWIQRDSLRPLVTAFGRASTRQLASAA
jgi:hypothetical protein